MKSDAAGRHARNQAIEEFGTIDSWVNNAGVSFYGTLTEAALEDMRRLFEVNFWGRSTERAPPLPGS